MIDKEKFVSAMARIWNVDASGVEPTEELMRSYFLQQELTRKLIGEGKILNPNKDCEFMRAWGREAQKQYEAQHQLVPQ